MIRSKGEAGRIDITLIQTAPAWEDAQSNRELLSGLIEEAGDTDVIVLPEMFSTGFSMASERLAETMSGETVRWLSQQAEKSRACVAGSAIIESEGRYYNRFLLVRPDGRITTYDKRHLFRMSSEHLHFSPGRARVVVDLGGWRVFPQVCYDLRFPVFSRNDLGFDVIIYVANWPASRRDHWMTLLRARAIENLCYVVGLNRIGTDGRGVEYAGDSMVIDFRGNLLLDLQNDESVASAKLDRGSLHSYREDFPAWEDADRFSVELSPGDAGLGTLSGSLGARTSGPPREPQ